jgi:uncharacterized protein (TIGR02246 family)
MYRHFGKAVLALVIFATPLVAQPAGNDLKAEDAIAETVAAYATAWNTADARALAGLYTMHADYTGFGSVMTRGRADIEARYQQLFAGVYNGSQAKIAISSLRFVKPDVAIVDGSLELTGIRGSDGKVAEPATALFIAIMTNEEGRWLFTTFWSKRVQLAAPSL